MDAVRWMFLERKGKNSFKWSLFLLSGAWLPHEGWKDSGKNF